MKNFLLGLIVGIGLMIVVDSYATQPTTDLFRDRIMNAVWNSSTNTLKIRLV